MAHARRKFFDSVGSSKRTAEEALPKIENLYAIERKAAEATPKERHTVRQEKSRPVLEQFKKWLDNQHLCALPKSPTGKVVTYALNNWQALCVFLEDGEPTIDNNRAEKGMRSIAVGRTNWLLPAVAKAVGTRPACPVLSPRASSTTSTCRHILPTF